MPPKIDTKPFSVLPCAPAPHVKHTDALRVPARPSTSSFTQSSDADWCATTASKLYQNAFAARPSLLVLPLAPPSQNNDTQKDDTNEGILLSDLP